MLLQEEYIVAKPARDAAAKAKMEAEALSTEEGPLHDDNEWNIRCLMIFYTIQCTSLCLHVYKRWCDMLSKKKERGGVICFMDVLNIIINVTNM